MTLARRINDILVGLINGERRVDPYFRPAFDRLCQRRLAAVVQALIVRRRAGAAGLGIAEETVLDNEAEIAAAIAATMAAFLHATYDRHPPMLRGGNTKTYGVVRGELAVSAAVPAALRHGLFAAPATYPVWARFGGPGPLAPADLKDNGIVSIGVKVMGVDGPKLLDDEQATQDFSGISAPTFTTPNIVENLELQRQIRKGTPIFYFLSPRRPHLLDALMQGLYAKAQRNPLYERYWSCSSYALGPGQAVRYSFIPVERRHTPFPRHPGPDYLRSAMVATLAERDVAFEMAVQLQTDPRRMPIEDDGVEWPERLSPFVPVARLRLPRQRFDAPAQLAFADNLAINPWHSLAAHRPLGNQNRARRHIYVELSRLRQEFNGTAHIEPTGAEVFDAEAVS
jgi:hypothetical protein